VAAALGGLTRYALQLAIPFREGDWPWGTFLINLSGSFALGLVVALVSQRAHVEPWMRTAVTVGFLGAFTTFSTLAFETTSLIDSGAWGRAWLYMGATAVLGVGAVLAGTALGQRL
jgi:CrcB protein